MKALPLFAVSFLLLTGCATDKPKEQPEQKIVAGAICFESSSPNASRATPLYDYLRLTIGPDGQITGDGAGNVMAGNMTWITNITGELKGDSLKLKVLYEVTNADYEGYQGPFTTTETWYFDSDRSHLWRNEGAALRNWLGEKEYHRIDCSEIPEHAAERIKKIRLR